MARWLGLGLVSLAALFLPGVAPAAQDSGLRRCAGRYAKVEAADAEAQVYAPDNIREPRYSGTVYGCTYRRRRSFRLGPDAYGSSSGSAGGVSSFKLNGPIVAFESGENLYCPEASIGCDPSITSETHWIVVRDLRNGRLLHRVPTGYPLVPRPKFVGVGNASFIAVARDGSVAWIVQDYERGNALLPPPNRYFEVYALDTHGERLLASGPDIKHYLRIMRHTVTWINGGKRESAPLR